MSASSALSGGTLELAEGSFLALSRDILSQGHSLCCRTVGSSMFPLFRSQSLVQVEPVQGRQLTPGDVIVYQSGEALVAHRLLKMEQRDGQTVLVTRGDSFRWSAIEHLTLDQVHGRVVTVEWPGRLKLHLDRGPGRRLGLLLARISPFLWTGCRLLSKGRRGLSGIFR